ncbi:uncharacterized protein ASPGLDRAFT_1197989 [Aspergillus glaucus CBS 516.65]|uniref:Glutathione S-transferase UstS-like C-terminal domain-containing protein n=1 Tax=Aspergillus glaucus CBS 516.65 TaxID=1160497 RepID=A0A1L9V418_ASPGL|nr:hypothetical protein ASPGLDRAFT_1197989 [Aspergillus glaucus CBS 516.65]OJJ78668.1 hypothetical protein ASPGLDRAFT_1197989 [Aspergillus glaucus CBS 516.65]
MIHGIPLDLATAEATKTEFVQRAGVTSWDDFAVSGEEREKPKNSLRDMLVDLAKLFLRDTSGPFLLGKQVSYADFIVGGWLRMMRGILPDNEWDCGRR